MPASTAKTALINWSEAFSGLGLVGGSIWLRICCTAYSVRKSTPPLPLLSPVPPRSPLKHLEVSNPEAKYLVKYVLISTISVVHYVVRICASYRLIQRRARVYIYLVPLYMDRRVLLRIPTRVPKRATVWDWATKEYFTFWWKRGPRSDLSLVVWLRMSDAHIMMGIFVFLKLL